MYVSLFHYSVDETNLRVYTEGFKKKASRILIYVHTFVQQWGLPRGGWPCRFVAFFLRNDVAALTVVNVAVVLLACANVAVAL